MIPQAASNVRPKLILPVIRWGFYRYCQKKSQDKKVEVFMKTKEEKSYLQSLFMDWSISPDTIALLNRKDAFTLDGFVNRAKDMMDNKNVKSQQFNKERHAILGPNLAAAHFLIRHGASVKFANSSLWIDKEKQQTLPRKFISNLYLEEINASNTDLIYEGFENLDHLFHLKKLILRNCQFVNDWCLDRLHIFADSLEHLDISSCTEVTERGLCSLHKVRKLKSLTVEDLPNVKHKELTYMMIEDYIPHINIIDSKHQRMLVET